MGYRMRSRLGTSLVATALLLMPVFLTYAPQAFAQGDDSEPDNPAVKKSKSLPHATITGKVTTTTEIVTSKNSSAMLSQSSAATLQSLRQRYVDIEANGGFPKVPKGNYKKGASSKGVAFLNRRLFMDGYLRKEAMDPLYVERVTSATVDAVARFQRNMGLATTGLVDGPTLAALNIPASARIATIDANIPRLETYAQNLGERYLVVNVPAQQIETVNGGKVFSRHNAIVGRPERPTPVVMTALSDINFNPYWNAPVSIVENDIIPKLRSGPRVLEEMNIKVFQGFGGPEVDPGSVNWRSAIADDYHFRQEPGPANAMATAKINFPSPFGIYLHDTPEKQLFQSGERFFSSGCVRVEKVDLLMEWILNGQDGIESSQIAALAETLERRDVKLLNPPQLRVAYLTAWPVGNTVAFRRDVYGLDGTGFIVGQPMPAGELSEDGQKFVLKPVPRKLASVDADEATGFGLFGSRKSSKTTKPRAGGFNSLFGEKDDHVSLGSTGPKKLPFAKQQPNTASGKVLVDARGKTKSKSGRTSPGLFDWATYRKEQKLNKNKQGEVAEKKLKKKINAKPAKAEAAIVGPKAKVVSTAASTTTALKKPVAKIASADGSDAKKPVTSGATAKKPAVPATKVAAACKPNAAGTVAKDCKPAAKAP
jgi:murein L,D-transpeptidase YcbB/YkuD